MKRSRYTVSYSPSTSNDVRREVILAYTAQGARDYFARRGTVLSVTKGDYRLQERRSGQRPTGAKPNHLAIRQAAQELRLALPLDIKVGSRQGGRQGAHSVRKGESVHHITVKSWLSADEMGRTLWHELTHAAQFEHQAGGDFDAWGRICRDGVGYKDKRIEREARAAEANNDRLRLAR